MRQTSVCFSLERVGILLLLPLVGCADGNRPAIAAPAKPEEAAAVATSAVTPPLPASAAAPDAGEVAARNADIDEPDGPVRFYRDRSAPERKVRFSPGESIGAELSLDAALASLRGHPKFVLEIELYSMTHEMLGRCPALTIDGSTREGAQALVSRTLTVSIIRRPHDDALLDSGCEVELRRQMLSERATASREIHGELRLDVLTYPAGDPQVRTLASGRFRLDLAGGPAAIAEGIAKLDENHEQERKDAIPTNLMPRSKMPSLDAAAMNAVQQAIADSPRTEFHPLRVVITDREWTLKRDPKSSVILFRSVSGLVAFRRPDKTCFQEDVTLSEDFDGIRYQAMDAALPRLPEGDDLLCANVWK